MSDNHFRRYFSPSEFPPGELERANPILLQLLGRLRDSLGAPIYPSPAPGALARLDGSEASKHYAVGRQSTAIDVFTEAPSAEFFRHAVHWFTGVGFYPFGQRRGTRWPRWHLDMRDSPLWWYQISKSPIYATGPVESSSLLKHVVYYDPPRATA